MRVMLAVEAKHSVVERDVQAERPRATARPALYVDERNPRLVPGHPAGELEPVTKIEILHVHPVTLVEQADGRQRFATDQHECSVHGVDWAGLNRRRSVLGKALRRPARTSDTQEMTERAADGRKRTSSGMVKSTVRLHKPATANPNVRPRLHLMHESLKHGFDETGIRIEQQHKRAPAATNREIARGRESEVLGQRDTTGGRKLRGEHLERAVRRGVIDDEDARPNVLALLQRGQTCTKKCTALKGNDDDVD